MVAWVVFGGFFQCLKLTLRKAKSDASYLNFWRAYPASKREGKVIFSKEKREKESHFTAAVLEQKGNGINI